MSETGLAPGLCSVTGQPVVCASCYVKAIVRSALPYLLRPYPIVQPCSLSNGITN